MEPLETPSDLSHVPRQLSGKPARDSLFRSLSPGLPKLVGSGNQAEVFTKTPDAVVFSGSWV